jgi:hypothetical protein
MKITEIITESLKEYDGVHPDHASTFSMAVSFPDMANQYYTMYRMGVNVAGQDGESKMRGQNSAIANKLVMMAYHPKELEMILATAEEMGHTPEHFSNTTSHEPDAVNNQSPVKSRGPVALKKKLAK